MSETGYARGSLSPVIYFERKDKYVILPPEEIGNAGIARRMYEEKYRGLGWEWREAGTLPEVDALQKRLVDQEIERTSKMADTVSASRAQVIRASADSLRARMCSSATTPFERDFIAEYLRCREDKRDKYRDQLTQGQWYLWAREQGSTTKFEDRMPDQPGEFWRSPEQVRNL